MENKSYFKYILIGVLIISITIGLFLYFNSSDSHEKSLNSTKSATDEGCVTNELKDEDHIFDDIVPDRKGANENHEPPIKIKQKITQPEFDKLYFDALEKDSVLINTEKIVKEDNSIQITISKIDSINKKINLEMNPREIDNLQREKNTNENLLKMLEKQRKDEEEFILRIKIRHLHSLLFEYDIDKDEISKSTIFEKKEVSQQEFDKMFQDLCKENETSYEYWSEKQIADSKEHNLKVLLFQYKIIS